ncbi:hypothetical protein [Halomonas sp. MS1]|nr:hypothetical protein [Halomonas sp. MS1]UTD54937.1 hypothetical protein NF683_17590 [Halomonas sp. MS1]
MATQENGAGYASGAALSAALVSDDRLRSVSAHTCNPGIIDLLTVTGLPAPARLYPTPDTCAETQKPRRVTGRASWCVAASFIHRQPIQIVDQPCY